MPNLGPPELLILLIIVLILFGVGRLGKIGGELGSGIRAFREGIRDPEKKGEGENSVPASESETEPESAPVDEEKEIPPVVDDSLEQK